MNLTIDIGNTRTKTTIFKDGKIVAKDVYDNFKVKELNSLLKNHPSIQRIILCSVTLVAKSLLNSIQKKKGSIILSYKTNVPIVNKYKSPKTLGNDRLAAVIGAKALYPKEACLVIDAGTCIKYDFISVRAHYNGGTISPGINMRLKAMHDYTAKLPLLKREAFSGLFGRNTRESMLTGAQLAASLEAEGFIRSYQKKYGHLKVILTGGDADFFAKRLKSKIFVCADLISIGLNKILNYNDLKS